MTGLPVRQSVAGRCEVGPDTCRADNALFNAAPARTNRRFSAGMYSKTLQYSALESFGRDSCYCD